jgi:hypothetical protein
MSLLNANSVGSSQTNAIQGGSSQLNKTLSSQSTPLSQLSGILSPIFGSDNDGLPSSKVPSMQQGVATRFTAHWFVPEVGIVNMYINPQNIGYNFKKLITPERTKGGYVVQYWGEEFGALSIRGHTGSSGVNGLNVLYEVYRAEQYLFDPIALTMAANNSIAGLNDLVDSALGNLGGFGSTAATATNGVFGLDPASQNILPRNIPSLASIALGIELYYAGWVFRGFFTSFGFTESVDRLGIFDYDIEFTVTQRRGYRTNYLPWQHSAIDGPSNWQTNPLSFSTLQTGSNIPNNST